MKTHDGPCFCPRCGRKETGEHALCPTCGDALVLQGYCAICEGFWPLRAGASCPKHDIDLEDGAPGLVNELEPGLAPNWVTVGTFADALRAEAPRIRLEAEGIPTFLEGARMGSHSMYQVATGGVKLQVPEPLQADARILLSQSWSAPVDDAEDAWDELGPEPGARRRAVMKGVIIFLLAAPLLLTLFRLAFSL